MSKDKEEIIEAYNLGCSMLIFSFNTIELQIKDVILRNYLAKSISQLKSITQLNQSGQVLDCYIIYRAMIDRLGHVYYLDRTKSYQEFDDWSFLRQYDANNNSLSDVNFKDTIPKDFFRPTKEDKERYKKIKAKGTKWNRPDIQDEFKKKGFYFLYSFGYDYASTHVHPMANDGMMEYYRMIRKPPSDIVEHFDHQTGLITQNSTLVSSMTVTECLNISSFKWMQLVYNFIDSFRLAINDQENEFQLNFLRMKKCIDEKIPLGEYVEKK